MRSGFKVFLLVILAFFTYLMVRITIPYLSFDDHTAFLRIKQWIMHNDVWRMSFYLHVITSCLCLLAGFTQFSPSLLRQYPKVHRYMGWLYVVVILLFSGPSGFVMSLYANGGIPSRLAFILLSVFWMYFTFMGFKYIRSGDLPLHQKFMIRSYALTLSALTLRAWKWLIVLLFRPHPMDAYQIVAWLGWIPNLLLAEWYIKMKYSHRTI